MILVLSGIASAALFIAFAMAIGYRLGYEKCRLDHEQFQSVWSGVVDELKQPVQQ